MAESNLADYGIVTLIVLLGLGFVYVGDPELESQPNYYCDVRAITAYCFELSSTEKTCYTEEGRTGGKVCRGSVWREISSVTAPSSRASPLKVTCVPGACG